MTGAFGELQLMLRSSQSMLCFVPIVGRRLALGFAALLLACPVHAQSNAAAEAPGEKKGKAIDFNRDVRPFFAGHCIACHGGKRQEGGLRLDHRDDALRGGDSGKAIVPGDADHSLLVERVVSRDELLRMPLEKPPLAASQIELLKAWIAAGAEWPPDSEEDRVVSDHWSFQPIVRPPVPLISRRDWACNPIDAFVLEHLEEANVEPSPEADREKLLRRLHLDLTGLPAAPSAVDEFLNDSRPDAYERLVDRLLASPHFGERWGQYWLDLARYADSDGYEMDHARPNAWRWRDWVIEAINADMPFDEFTIQQLAGDLLPGADSPRRLATGFHRNTLTNTENGVDPEEFRVKAIIDRVNTTGTVWLGLTIGCAECHSHKYDPIRQHEYYGLFAFFNDLVDEAELAVEATPGDLARFARGQAEYEAKLQKLESELASATDKARKSLEKRLSGLKKKAPQLKPVAAVFRSRDKPRQTHVHLRGNFLAQGEAVKAGVPQLFPPLAESEAPRTRLDLARWLVDPQNPLTARVEANRLWQRLFGAGLVRTPDDFGTQGERPTHPELLDWLASELQRQGWSRKQMIRLIVQSAAYRQDSALRPELAEVDPVNRLLARQNRHRLDAETVRDQYLAAGGLLNRRIGGPSFYPPLPEGLSQIGFTVDWRVDPLAEQYRRGIYLVVRRNLAYPMLTTFDRPDANVTCTRRERSNTPMQSLTQLNDPLVVACARNLAKQMSHDSTQSSSGRIELAFRHCLARRPTMQERQSLEALYQRLLGVYRDQPQMAATLAGDSADQTAGDSVELAAWTVLVRTIMNLDEFVTRE